MKNTQNGFGGILIIILIALLAAGGGSYIYTKTAGNNATTAVTIGVTSDTKTPITATITPKVDSTGKETFSIVVNQSELNQAVSEKYNNSSGKRKVIKDELINILGLFKSYDVYSLKEKEGDYKKTCDIATYSLKNRAQERMSNPDNVEFNASLGITLESFRLSEYKCKSSDDVFVLTIPFTNEAGKESTVCVNQYTKGIGVGNFNFESLDADKLSCTWVK